MRTEFRRVTLPEEIRRLLMFDRKVFSKSDLFSIKEWKTYETYWMIIEGTRVGCCAIQRDVDFSEDIRDDRVNSAMKGSLYISTTGILPKFQHRGLGQLFKSWQIAYARSHGFRRIVTNTRERNIRMIALNKRFNFRTLRTTPGYYSAPNDATVVMELRLSS